MSQGGEVSVVPPAVQRDGSVALCCIQLVTAAGSGGKMYIMICSSQWLFIFSGTSLFQPHLGPSKVAGLER